MNGSPVKRRLAAIMSIDVVSYSAMMGADEEGTMRVLRTHRTAIDSSIRRHGGRIANTAGDSVLAEFGSPVEAVRSALDVQAGIDTRNNSLPPSQRMLFRIGVHLDDVIVQDNGDLLGEGVNIAARLQAAADPGGVMVSGEVAGQARAKMPEYGFERLGRPVMKNIVRTVEAFRVVSGARARQIARADVSSAPGAPHATAEKKAHISGFVIAAAVIAGLLGGGAVAWGIFAFSGGGPVGDGKEAEAIARRKAAEADAARKQAADDAEAARRKAAEADAARQQAAAAEAARRQAEQEAVDRRHKRANQTRSLSWADIPCAQSRIAAGQGMTCSASAEYDGVDGRGKFRRWAAGTHAATTATYVMLVDTVDAASVHLPLRRDDESEFLLEISSFTRNNAREWSSLAALGDSLYVTFKAVDGRSCFAFAKPGPARGDGLAWVMRGYHCVASGQSLVADRIALVIGTLKAR
ncbi:adenylate/guanylate cyclase domain-containing protein [Reyranella sp. CPCC 100927]|uniref:adenylate/guanylate cyclase domain-containing protein n=1 Tax=Reyranella sp. CPCC 100927 TaxID=2599616 RepID=UPI0015B59E6E|nr:adenylate/guanylate cyclase domain-containing protein [Reyranella sp. CPCC 100927]